MKIIHAADLHIGSPFTELPEPLRDKRRIELLDTFVELVSYAQSNDIRVILLSGDVFDSNRVKKADKEFFYSIIENNKEIDFLYLKGNHDINSMIERNDIPNLKLFDNTRWLSYQYDDVLISGIELDDVNYKVLYDSLSLNKNFFNIVMIHGQDSVVIKKPGIDINIKKFINKNIDYIALGHIHKHSINRLDEKTVYAYPGILEGRGFDEAGAKGFILIDTSNKKYEFVEFAKRKIYKINIDITDSNSIYSVMQNIDVKISNISLESVVQIILSGKVDYDISYLEASVLNKYKVRFLHLDVKCIVSKKIHYEDYIDDNSLRGEVIKEVLRSDLDEGQKDEILGYCLKLFNKEDIEI